MHKENQCELRVTGYAPWGGEFEFTKRNLQPVTAVTFRFEELGILFA